MTVRCAVDEVCGAVLEIVLVLEFPPTDELGNLIQSAE